MKVALIGTGAVGKKYAILLGEQLSAVVCRSEENKQWAAETLGGGVRIYGSTEALYADPDAYDAVVIATPHKTHPDFAMQAFALGKHVLCDKPAGVSLLQAQQMQEAATAAGLGYAMMFHQRCYSKYKRMKQLLDAGTIGEVKRVLLVNSRYYRTSYYHQSSSWRSSWDGEGGGLLINQAQHLLDIWQWLFGVPESIYAHIPFGKYNDFLVDDEVTIQMSYGNKMSAVCIISTGEAQYEERLEIIGSKGSMVLEDTKLSITTYSEDAVAYGKTAQVWGREQLAFTTQVEVFEEKEETFDCMFANFFKAVAGEEAFIATGVDGIATLSIVNAAYLSAWEGKPVQLPIDGAAYEAKLAAHIAQERAMKQVDQ